MSRGSAVCRTVRCRVSSTVLVDEVHKERGPRSAYQKRLPTGHRRPCVIAACREIGSRRYPALRRPVNAGGRVHGADGVAELLGINPSMLRSHMQKLGISARNGET